MCIVEYFPPGVDKDSEFVKESIRQGARSNGAGLGFAFKKNGRLYLHKGFLSSEVEVLIKEIESHALGKEDELLFHARIATSGGTRAEMTHPFVCSNDIEEVGFLKGYVDKPVLAHNGVFVGWGNTKYSDTFRFAHIILSEPAAISLLKLDPEAFATATKEVLSTNKIAVMFPGKDETRLLGDFYTDKDCKFSNGGYKSYVRNVGGVETRGNFRGEGQASLLPAFNSRTDDDDWEGGEDGFEDFRHGQSVVPNQGAHVGRVRSTQIRGIHPFKLDERFVHSGVFYNWPVIYSNVGIVPNIFNYDLIVGTCIRDLSNHRKGDRLFLNSYDPFAGTAICTNIEDSKNVLADYELIKDLVVNCTFQPKASEGAFLREYTKINNILFDIRKDSDRELYDADDILPLSKTKMKDIYKFIVDQAINFVGQKIYIKANKSKYALIDSPNKAQAALQNIVSTDALILWYAERQHLFPKDLRLSQAIVTAVLKKDRSLFEEFGVGMGHVAF